MTKRVLMALAAAPMALLGCHGSDSGDDGPGSDPNPDPTLPTDAPTSVTKVASGDFRSPTDAVASPDGKTFYFAAFDDDTNASIWQTSSAPDSTAQKVSTGSLLDLPIGLVLSCDGNTLYIADLGTGDGTAGEPVAENGAILAMSVGDGSMTNLNVTGVNRPAGLAMGPDCNTLYVTGRGNDGRPTLYTVPSGGGIAAQVWAGAPLVAPTGLYVDKQGVAWVMDHLATGDSGEGVLFSIPSDGSTAQVVASGLRMGTPGGVSLTAGGGTAVMATVDAAGAGQLTSIDLASGELTNTSTPNLVEPAGLRTARAAGVFAVVDTEAGAIYRAE